MVYRECEEWGKCMTLYEYRCSAHGTTEARFPMGAAPSHVPCFVCGGDARRAFSVPRLGSIAAATHKLQDACEASAERPAVVSAVPGGKAVRAAPKALDPRMQGLPRP